MTHNHKHDHCKHEHLKYCAHCDKPYCLDCSKEWNTYNLSYYQTPWNSTTSSYYLGNTTSGNNSLSAIQQSQTSAQNSQNALYQQLQNQSTCKHSDL